MTSIINKIFHRDDDSHANSSSHSTETSTKHTHAQGNTDADAHVTEGRTVQHEGVNIKSTISSDVQSTVSVANQQKLNNLVTKLGSTHTQIDEYAKKQTAKINEEIKREIDEVVARTRREQDDLLRQANEHTAQIDAEYRARLQKMVEEIDAAKATRIAGIEKELNDRQTSILQLARAEIDQLNQKAAGMKIDALQQAQAIAAAEATAITTEAAHLGQASTVHQSAGTTTIKTEVTAATTTKETDTTTARQGQTCVAGGAATATDCHKTNTCAGGAKTSHCSETKTVETSRHQSNDSNRK